MVYHALSCYLAFFSRLLCVVFCSHLYILNCQRGQPALDGHLTSLAARHVYLLFLLLYSDFVANKYDDDGGGGGGDDDD